MPIILPENIHYNIGIHALTDDDIIIIIEQIKLNTYFDFYNFMKNNKSLPIIVYESLPAWYIKITNKCNDCNLNMNIINYDNDRKLYKCSKCNKKYCFNIYDIDKYINYKLKILLNII